MNKKKLFLVILSCIMVLSFAACGKDKEAASPPPEDKVDAYAEFTKVQENMQDIKDAEFKIAMDMNMDDGKSEKPENMKMDMNVQMVKVSEKNVEMKMDYSTNAESAVDGTTYMKNNNLFMDVAGQKIKIAADSEMSALMSMDTEQMINIQKDMVTDITMEEDGDNRVFQFKMNPEKAMDYLKKSGAESATQSLEGMKVGTMDVTIVADKDNMAKSVDIVSDMGMTSGDQKVNVAYKMKLDYVSVNTGIKIKFPDFKKYEEMSVGS